MNLKTIHNVFFIGIGGVGMSALARYFALDGKVVGGYDKTPTLITQSLIELGIHVQFKIDLNQINEQFFNSKDTLIVFTPAISESNAILEYFRTHDFQVLKRSEVLCLVTEYTQCLAVAGTHGKTTTCSILGHLLFACNEKVTAFIGGISENYQSNLIQNGTDISVVEADEFDRSFLTLSPDFACITSMDADHLDIYNSESDLIETFKQFVQKIKPKGKLFIRKGLPLDGITYGINEAADYSATNIQILKGCYQFDLQTPQVLVQNITFHLPGEHNLSNAIAALAMALEFGCQPENLKRGLSTYKGVKRRFTYQIKTDDFVFIDDYAHHPESIRALSYWIGNCSYLRRAFF